MLCAMLCITLCSLLFFGEKKKKAISNLSKESDKYMAKANLP